MSDVVAIREVIKQQANMRFMFEAICDEYPKAVCAGRGQPWVEMLRSYVELCASMIPLVEKRSEQPVDAS